ncbi:MAG: hypothetical protein R3B06_05505 [Kofleriaceae bacterium]
MRNLIVLAALLVPLAAHADNDYAGAVAGTFDLKYAEVTSNCTNTGIALNRGSGVIAKRKGNAITIDIERMPLMAGSASKGGRIKATSKLGRTSIQGLDGRFSAAGTVNNDHVLNMVLVAEYYLSGKAYCTQSWNVSGGLKPDDAPKAQAEDGAAPLPAALPPWELNQPLR